MLKTENATLSDFIVKVPGKDYTVLVTPINTGNVTVMIEANKVVDLAGNPNGDSNLIRLTYIELDAPLLNISTSGAVDTLDHSPSKIIFTFNQDVTGFISNDINVVNGSISN